MADYTTQFHNDIIKVVGRGMNISRTYPKGHPSLQPVIRRLKVLLKEVPMELESVSLVVIEDVINIEDDRFDAKTLPMVKSLVTRFNQLGVKSITFNVDLSESDIREFFNAMAATRADLDDYGDIVALMKAKGIVGIVINKFRVGVISSDEEVPAMNWEQFLESLTETRATMTEEERVKELSSFLAGVGIAGNEPAQVQTSKIISGLEKVALLVADQYGEDRWDEYSLIFSRMLAALSPTIKKNVVRYRTENKKLAVLFKNLLPTMSDEDIIDVITTKAKEKSPTVETEVIDILKNVTGTRLPGILSTLRVNVPELDFEKIASRLMIEMKVSKGEKIAEKFLSKNLETQMRTIFPRLRAGLPEERTKAVGDLMEFTDKIFEAKKYDLVRLLVDRFDTMADAETEMSTFTKVIESLKNLYLKSRALRKDDLVGFISKKFGKHLLRKDAALLDRKKIIIKTISEIKDENYVPELISLLWDQGTFTDAREALTSLSDFSAPLLIESLKDTDDRSVRMKIIDVLVRIGDKAIPQIEGLLSSQEWYIRRNGVFILGEMKVSSAVDKIGKLVDDAEEQVQLAVVESLNNIGGEKVKDYFRKALSSRYKDVVVAAMKRLEKNDVKQKFSEMSQWLKSRKGIPNEKEERSRCAIIEVMGKFGDDSVIDSLVGVLHEKALFKGKLLEPTKSAALNALSQIGSSKALQALRDAANHKDDFVASTAQDILNKVKKNDS